MLPENAKLVVNFINSELQHNNIKVLTKKNKIQVIDEFNKFLIKKYGHEKPLKQVVRDDFLDFQTSKRKSENDDPMHKWVGTYNQFLRNLKTFYKWLFYPDSEPKNRKLPDCLVGVNQLNRKEKTCYSASDMWTFEEDQLFLRYCEDPLIRLYHVMSRDFSNRPHELLNLRIGKVVEGRDSNGKKYATASIGAGGKTKQRTVAMYKSYPYYVEYLQKYHPTPTNPDSFLFRNRGQRFRYINKPIQTSTLSAIYWKLRHIFFPKLLNDQAPTEDKEKIKLLFKKPWNPYVRRHTGLTEKVTLPQVNEFNFKQHGGWTKNSLMPLIYTHELADTSCNALLASWGIKIKNDNVEEKPVSVNCVCGTPNTPNAKYCSVCNRVLSYEGFVEVEEEKKKQEQETERMNLKFENMQRQMNIIMDHMQLNNKTKEELIPKRKGADTLVFRNGENWKRNKKGNLEVVVGWEDMAFIKNSKEGKLELDERMI